ncbi:MAG: N-acetyltransferase [Proteobacteria bacterium]|nr:MAG: N-acetyltransferase [Pseudomonadota bacterium]
MRISQTNRLQLRHINQSDADFLFDLYNQAPFIKHIGDRGLSSLSKTRDFIEVVRANYKKYGFWLYLVEDKLTKEPIGVNGLVRRDYLDAPDIGFAISQDYWRQGFAYESSLAVIEHARQLKLHKLLAIISPNNISSIKLIEKLGFSFVKQDQFNPEEQAVNLYQKNSLLQILNNN